MNSEKKRRILFYSENFCGDKTKGGLEQATYRIAKALKRGGNWDVYNAFRSKWDGKDKSVYREVVKLSREDGAFERSLTDFINRNEIDVVVNMSRFFRHKLISRAARKSKRAVKVMFMQHFAPGSEKKKGTYASGRHLLKLNPYNPLYWLRATIYPLLKLPRNLRWNKVYRQTYNESDRVILLSEGYAEKYKEIAGINDKSKFIAIANIFDSERRDIAKNIRKKEKRVLILSRMDEIQKRISLALMIWKKIMAEEDLDDWHLDIVGTGHDTGIMKRLAKKLKLKNVTFHGWQKREPFLERSAILMMTSEYEGLPLSILEAQAYGCVPIAFDSYSSIRDVVSHGKDGILIENFGDTDSFAAELAKLMRNENKRLEMAENGISNTDKFSSERIIGKWNELLNEL